MQKERSAGTALGYLSRNLVHSSKVWWGIVKVVWCSVRRRDKWPVEALITFVGVVK